MIVPKPSEVMRFLLLVLVWTLTGCDTVFGPLNNPVDPQGSSYSGYPTATADSIRILSSFPGPCLFCPDLRATAVPGAKGYDLQVSKDQAFTQLSGSWTGLTGPVLATGAKVLPVGLYYARVRAIPATGVGPWSPSMTFTIADPKLIRPNDGALLSTEAPTLEWDLGSGAIFYEISYSSDKLFATETVRVVPGSTAKVPLATGSWYWRVRASNSSGTASGWSTPRQITTSQPQPTALKLVAGGSYNNGSSKVTVSSFQIAPVETTQELYEKVMGTTPSAILGDKQRPVERVSWFDAVDFCNKLSLLNELDPVYTVKPAAGTAGASPTVTQDLNKSGYRLPTEAEWGWAARGGLLTHNFIYSGSSTYTEVGWFKQNTLSTTHPVGKLTANELGLFDLSGNVAEWVWDYNGILPTSTQTNPLGPAQGSDRIIAGGSWRDQTKAITARGWSSPQQKLDSIGFRIVAKANSPVAIAQLSVVPSTITLPLGTKTGRLVALVTPLSVTDPSVRWTSSQSSVVGIDPVSGSLSPISLGQATITATAVQGGKTATCIITVVP